jgi:ribosomal protein S3
MSKLPSHILGLKIRVSGRLASERSRPRFTVQTAETGTFSKNNLSLVQVRSSTAKNKKNRYTVKVWLNQRANIKKTR